jgi:endonuclease-3
VPDLVSEELPARKKAGSKRRKRETRQEKIVRANAIARHLAQGYSGAECPLAHRNTFELLAAVILSAQCTDAAVNKVTPELFRRFPTPDALSQAEITDIEPLIRTLGLFRAKAKSLN